MTNVGDRWLLNLGAIEFATSSPYFLKKQLESKIVRVHCLIRIAVVENLHLEPKE